ncbi:hypothetical protein F5144DRAFT_333569 [Chaetomium tenue]|uniref:Uncharacterized protein n=1 Tax=Chaetomium tenue TaxID=1854479 RepID=A0ACB7P1P3_9PEZI|nr:hypothetical protein F5144DRAFT_333569 [Chaetomium globosum]
MEFKPNDASITSESAPLIEPVDCENDRDLFMVPLKRPSPRLPPSRYRNVKARTPPRSPVALSPRSNLQKSPQPVSQLAGSPYIGSPMSGHTVKKPDSPPMFTSPLMSPESGGGLMSPQESGVLGIDGILNANMATPGSLIYNSPPMSQGRNTKVGSSPVMSTEAGSAHQSPEMPSSSKENTTSASRSTGDKPNTSTKASSVYDSPPAIVENKPEGDHPTDAQQEATAPPAIPPLSAARNTTSTSAKQARNLGLALHLSPNPNNNTTTNPTTINPALLTIPNPKSPHSPRTPGNATNPNPSANNTPWLVPDSPLERLSQLRATPDSAYDRARQMEVRRSEWKHVVYRFPVKGAEHWVIDADLTESSHARLADVARRSSEGFEWNGDYELANIYRVLAVAHTRVMEEMRGERRGVRAAA